MEINFKKKIGNLELCPVTYLNGKKPDTLEICQWDKDDAYRWTILEFRYNEKEEYFYVEECGDRLKDERIDWVVLGELVRLGRKCLELVKEFEDKDE